ncbi:hypothetical protein HPB47_018709 [Ixodes persulcatus]|uniref:Uncharacterized protein n=1 Tax=Ixodes persulcatus TaxID=34615 RepID=A0AC60R198_IXOPE|nr:hypothetical protein HPB47_018709 [Ixodes persulcatus]
MDTSLGLTTGPQSAKSENVTRNISSTGHPAINLPIDPGLLDLLGIAGDEIGKLFMCFLAQLAEERQQKARLNNANEAEEAMAFRVRDIVSAAEKAGVTKDDDFKIQYQARTNTIALTAQDEKTAEKLLQLTEVQKGGDQYAIRPYKAIGRDQIRGIIYLPGDNRDETPETLMQDMKCKTSRIVNARLIGKSKNVVLVTFESKKLPKTVIFSNAILGMKENLPRPIVCFKCYGLGHKTDVCPRKAQRCGHCGQLHDEEMENCHREPRCHNCEGKHVATSNACPKRKIPEKRKPSLKPPEAQPRDSYAAAASASTKEPKPAGEISRTGLPAWMPEWANPTPPQTPQTSTFNAEREVDKLQAEMKMGFRALFEVIGELRREIAELKHGKHETVDPEEQAELARQARKVYLRGLLPPQEDKIPAGYSRWAAVRVRRIRTKTACTPAKLASFGLLEPEEAKCKTCTGNNMATL